jgi:hyperosmotically inducible protein
MSGVLSASLGATSGVAQESNVPASVSMHRAGESAGNAATSAGHAVEHTYHGAATALKDTAITAKVKTALHENKSTKDSDVVTLTGSVPSSEVSEHAQHAAEQTTGVKGVKNQLAVAPTAAH